MSAISREGTSAWLANLGYPRLADAVMNEERFPSEQTEHIQNNSVHLCDSCQHTFPLCPSHDSDVIFGDGKGNDNICACNKYRPALNRVLEAPTIEPERKTGTWKGYNADNQNWLRTDGSPVFLICSECGQVVVNNFSAHWNYCSNCGLKMKMEVEG